MNIAKILKKCPKGTKLWSPICGDCILVEVNMTYVNCIHVKGINPVLEYGFNQEGCLYDGIANTECVLFPSKNQRDWSKFEPITFHLEDLKPFDKVLYRDYKEQTWKASLLSYILDDCYYTVDGELYNYIIPFNEETECLWNTTKEAPRKYQWWKNSLF